ncbi:MAG: type II secretion system protein [Planctomycetota bacterium]
MSHGSRSAFTLIEVVVGLTLMATLLVSSLLAFTAHRRQLAAAMRKQQAIELADDLLSRLESSREGIQPLKSGAVAGHPNWFWQTRLIGVTAPMRFECQVIRFEIIDRTPRGDARVLTSVDLLKRLP